MEYIIYRLVLFSFFLFFILLLRTICHFESLNENKNTPLVFNISSPYLQLSLSFNKKRYKLLFTLWCGEHSKYCLYKMIEDI